MHSYSAHNESMQLLSRQHEVPCVATFADLGGNTPIPMPDAAVDPKPPAVLDTQASADPAGGHRPLLRSFSSDPIREGDLVHGTFH
jgi:hypothetical protein